MQYHIKQIGIIRTGFQNPSDAPIQGVFKPDSKGQVEVYEEYASGLDGIEGFSHLILLYWFHRAKEFSLSAAPFLDPENPMGIFSIRKPGRPNPIGLSVVKLESRQGGILNVSQVDMLDGSPLLDIKPLVPEFDFREDVKIGWLNGKLR
ncbi:MAG TPA: tRNA (N6-threonylcarbamoyladenosine(37)-N6)-methyltransferase TrmO [bacterium]|nr:tRNA (N6-threonylcarbamoyladenosine(37)-N6)-methyltransferase TrmO [bacterium]